MAFVSVGALIVKKMPLACVQDEEPVTSAVFCGGLYLSYARLYASVSGTIQKCL
jgi:hypothetical protein